jgi:NAD(P)-dependent dehydrogenase (short-subunit alcohol dehydrogenase family)
MPFTGFHNRIVLLSGAASGIGEALARELSASGARLYVCDLNPERLSEAASRWAQPPHGMMALDVGDSEALRRWIRQTAEAEGRIDYLFSNAGIGMAGEFRFMEPSDWEKVCRVNLDSVVHGCHEAFRFMAKHGGGHLVNTASLLGITPSPLASLYSVTKHGVMGLSNTLAIEGRHLNIRVTAVCPGYIRTAIFDDAVVRETTSKDMLQFLPWTMATPEATARVILRAVLRGRRRVIYPFHARFSHWAWRWLPGLYLRYNARQMQRHRKTATQNQA